MALLLVSRRHIEYELMSIHLNVLRAGISQGELNNKRLEGSTKSERMTADSWAFTREEVDLLSAGKRR